MFENSHAKLIAQKMRSEHTHTHRNMHAPQIVQTNAKDIKDLKIQWNSIRKIDETKLTISFGAQLVKRK